MVGTLVALVLRLLALLTLLAVGTLVALGLRLLALLTLLVVGTLVALVLRLLALLTLLVVLTVLCRRTRLAVVMLLLVRFGGPITLWVGASRLWRCQVQEASRLGTAPLSRTMYSVRMVQCEG